MSRLGRHESIIAVIGPSGTGKSSVVRALADEGLVAVTPSWTTRPPRVEERGGCIEHRFMSDAECDRLEAEGFFLACVSMFGLPFRYGLPAVERGAAHQVPLVMMRASLLPLLRQHYPALTVYQFEDSRGRALERLQSRDGDTTAGLGSRVTDYDAEIAQGRLVAHRVFVNDSDLATITAQVRLALLADFAARSAAAP